MSTNRYYDQCVHGMGRCVRIKTHDGNIHTGIIQKVSRNKVFILPLQNRKNNYGGFGYYRGYGPGAGWGWGAAAIGFSFGLIAALVFLPFF